MHAHRLPNAFATKRSANTLPGFLGTLVRQLYTRAVFQGSAGGQDTWLAESIHQVNPKEIQEREASTPEETDPYSGIVTLACNCGTCL